MREWREWSAEDFSEVRRWMSAVCRSIVCCKWWLSVGEGCVFGGGVESSDRWRFQDDPVAVTRFAAIAVPNGIAINEFVEATIDDDDD